jgi:hypothetical protein
MKIKPKEICIIFFLFSIFLFQSCLLIKGIIVEIDNVYSIKRIKANFTYNNCQERPSPFISLEQTIIKEMESNTMFSYKVYDILTLQAKSFELEKKFFIIVDNEPFQVDFVDIYSESISSVVESREDILTSDSTKVSVVTGYKENQNKYYRIKYIIDNDIIDKMVFSENVMLRYYAGTRYDYNKNQQI